MFVVELLHGMGLKDEVEHLAEKLEEKSQASVKSNLVDVFVVEELPVKDMLVVVSPEWNMLVTQHIPDNHKEYNMAMDASAKSTSSVWATLVEKPYRS